MAGPAKPSIRLLQHTHEVAVDVADIVAGVFEEAAFHPGTGAGVVMVVASIVHRERTTGRTLQSHVQQGMTVRVKRAKALIRRAADRDPEVHHVLAATHKGTVTAALDQPARIEHVDDYFTATRIRAGCEVVPQKAPRFGRGLVDSDDLAGDGPLILAPRLVCQSP